MGEEIVPVAGAIESVEEVQKSDEKRWYHHGGRYVTFEEFRETPLGRDSLNDDEGEQLLEKKWLELQPESEHRIAGDCWALQEMANDEVPFTMLSVFGKVEYVVQTFTKVCAVFGVLYLFIIALGLMGNAFKILGGRSSGRTFRDSDLLSNPVAGLAIGILATVLMQSSSTTTSIVISMAASDLVTVENAAYLVMGANIGTSVTNTIVSIAHLNSPEEYRRAFTGAVFHDMFNWLTVSIFLPLEVASGFLKELAGSAVDSLDLSSEAREKTEFIKKITKPAEGRVVSVDSKLIEKIAGAEDSEAVKELEKQTIIKQSTGHVFRQSPISDEAAGALLLFISLAMLTVCLLMLVKLLGSVLKGRVAIWTRYLLNIDFKHPILRSCGGFDNYILLFFGIGMTILVQSSSVFTSTMTPLVGIGLIHIEKMVPLTHGANIGTTVTGVLSALSSSNIDIGMRVALEHVFFNCLGTCVWFVVWPLRPAPLSMAKIMGELAANLRWFPLAYILFGFVAVPGLVVGLSAAGWEVLVGVGVPLLLAFLSFVLVAWLRRSRADLLPREGALSVLRSETAPCGCRYPNFLQLWGGDVDADRVDIAELQRREKEHARKVNSVAEWHYSPPAWGLTFLAFFGVLLAVNTAQWRRVQYRVEPEVMGRSEIGLGFTKMCSPQYEETHSFATPPPVCDATNVRRCARELLRSCEEDNEWATEPPTSNEKSQYAAAWERCSEHVGCRGFDWTRECTDLEECRGRRHHAENCKNTMAAVWWYFTRDAEAHGVEVTYEYSGVDEVETLVLPHDNRFESTAAEDVKVEQYPTANMPRVAADQQRPSLGGIGFDSCTGEGFVITKRGQTTTCNNDLVFTTTDFVPSFSSAHLVRSVTRETTTLAVDFAFEENAAAGWTGLTETTGLPNVEHRTSDGTDCTNVATNPAVWNGISPAGIRKLGDDLFVTSDKYGSRLMIFRSSGEMVKSLVPADSPYADGTVDTGSLVVEPTLPAYFYTPDIANRNSIGSVAVKPDGSKMAVCMRKPLSGRRLVRCAMLNHDLTDGSVTLDSEKVVMLSDTRMSSGTGEIHENLVGELEIAAATWLSGDKVLLLERDGRSDSSTGSSLYEVDLGTGTDVQGLAAEDLEGALDETVPYLAVSMANLRPTQVIPATMTLRATSEDFGGDAKVNSPVIDIFVGDAATVVMLEDALWNAAANNIMSVTLTTTLPFEGGDCKVGIEPVRAPMVGVEHETRCHDINDICIEGDLAGDMKGVQGLAISATVFMGLTLPALIVYSFVPYHRIAKYLIFVALATLVLSWVFSLASWAHMSSLTQNEYGCIFVDENIRGGLVVLRGKLEWLTRDSYSWGFMIFAWGMISIPLAFVIHRVVRITCLPYDSKFAVEANEDVLDGMPRAGKNEPVA